MIFSSLRTRLIALCVSIVIFAMIAVTLTNFLTTRSRISESVDRQTQQLADSQAAMIALWVQSKKAVVASMKPTAATADPLAAIQIAKTAGDFDLAYIAYSDKHAVFSEQRKRAADYDPTARPWYINASKASGPIITPPYIGASSGKLLVTFAEAVTANGGAVSAVAGADVLLDSVTSSVVSIKPTPNSFSFLIDSNNRIIAHPDQSLTLKPLSNLDASLTSQKLAEIDKVKQHLSVRLNDRDGMLYVTKIAGTDWLLAICLDKADATQTLSAIVSASAITAAIVILAAVLLLGFVIAKALQRLQLVRDALDEIAAGDLTPRLSTQGADELSQMASALNRFADKITSVLLNIRGASESVKATADEIVQGNADLSVRTQAQTSSLENTASVMEELTSTVKQNADNAGQANQLAESASNIASEGGVMVSKVNETMSTINASSKRIVDIIGVIDSIAFQTNILALNAAVEAARAGEQGRGFAVVASEVRSLAQRSATAAKEINILINDSVAQVNVGSKMVEQAGTTMAEVVDSVKRVNDVVAEITVASHEQSMGISQVHDAITDLDKIAQQNATQVDDAMATAATLQQRAAMLAQIVDAFKFDDSKVTVRTLSECRHIVRENRYTIEQGDEHEEPR
jgi:methyl-accepting chemotaxis protein